MFGLPPVTVLIIVGIIAFWFIYTGVFLYVSRGWHKEEHVDVGGARAAATGSVSETSTGAGVHAG